MLRQRVSTSATAGVGGATSSSCWLMLLGLFFIVMQCDARAVNVSNTWTMPQEGLNVFYRFFRDRISWFEADAVCQFHHANLVTVDNSFQFDATRDLLRELDVNDIVWIGLMRPQSSDRFMWSNSRPLVADTGYWAETLPLMDSPLCAVIDPIRDYRWHALRCGGPETASFLCEMPVPSWADTCILKDMPNLTMQYMADTASIELIRNCQEEGLLRTMCRGKQDRDRALQDLICPRERLEAQRINDITNSHFKSLQIINSIPTDNNENNDIELLPMDLNYAPHYPEELQTEKNTVQRLIEQFNVDELMQADEPANMETVSSFYKMPELIPKPVKKSAKKVVEYPKKDTNNKHKIVILQNMEKDKNQYGLNMDDMMLGDQPQGEAEMTEQMLNEEVSNEIMEPLPHIKKTNLHKDDMSKMEKEAIAIKESMQKIKEIEAKRMSPSTKKAMGTEALSSSGSTTTKPSISTTQELDLTETTARQHNEASSTEQEHVASTTMAPATIGHPMHPQQPRSNVITEEAQHPHVKESADNSHFIPPMLLVKSHYVPPANKHGHNEHHAHAEHLDATTSSSNIGNAATSNSEDLAETRKHNDMLMTTPKVIDFEPSTTLKALVKDNDKKPQEPEQQQQQQIATESAAATTSITEEEQTTENGNMKPITQHKPEAEEHKNSENMNFEEVPATTSTIVATTTNAATLKPALANKQQITLQTTTMKLIQEYKSHANEDKNNGNVADDEDVAAAEVTKTIVTQELKPHTDIETEETTPTAKLVETTTTSTSFTNPPTAAAEAQQHDLLTVTTQTDEATTTKQTTTAAEIATAKSEQMEQKSDLPLQPQQITKPLAIAAETEATTAGTEQATETTAAIVAATTTKLKLLTTDMQNRQTATFVEEKNSNEENQQQQQQQQQQQLKAINNNDNKELDETIVTTEKLTTAAAQTTLATISSTTTNDMPIQEINKNITATSSSNSNNNTPKEIATATTIVAMTSTTTSMPTTSSTTPIATTSAFVANWSASSTTGSSSTTTTTTTEAATSDSPETTRNFLKVTTEMPFKPNRRRSLTKPETVSYMKKILG